MSITKRAFSFYFTAFLLFIPFLFYAQSKEIFNKEKFSIEGYVIDKISKESLPSANIVLIDLKTNTTINFRTTDKTGRFVFDKLDKGLYQIAISFVGYRKKIIDSLKLLNNNIVLVKLPMEKQDVVINQVEVVAEKNPFQFNMDKLVVNVDKVKGSDTETVTELLQKVPFVQVFNKKIMLNGNSNISILIDGKKSNLTTYDILDQTLLNNIERIDVMSNPSAKYAAEGGGGIIVMLKLETNFYKI